MTDAPEINALLVSPDSDMAGLFSRLLKEIGVTSHDCTDESLVPEFLSNSKFEAVVLDLDNVRAGVPVIENLRASSSSKNAIVFAVATQVCHRQQAFAHGANFAFERPFSISHIRQALETAHALMLRDRRRYFRCPLEIPVQITKGSGQQCSGVSMNVSGNGLALTHRVTLNTGERVSLCFFIPEANLSINAIGTVVWDDKHGKAGVTFECDLPAQGKMLAAWLDAQFYRRLKSGGSATTMPLGESR